MKRILVTGGKGQLGSELATMAEQYSQFQFQFVDVAELDLTNSSAVKNFIATGNFQFIINCAAYTAVDKAEEDAALCARVNADAVKAIAISARETNARMIHISTDYVFDGNFNQPIDENEPPRPVSVYGKTKLDGERFAQEELPNVYIIRTAWVYSTFGKNFVKTIAGLAKQREELGIVSDQYGSPTYARDLASAIMKIVVAVDSKKVDQPGIYHYSSEGTISWYDFAWFINDYYKFHCRIKPIKTSEYKTLATRPKFSVLDKTKIKTIFGIGIPHWSQSLRECLNKIEL